MSKAKQMLDLFEGKAPSTAKPTNEGGVITKKFKEPSKPALNEVSPQEIVQKVIHALNNFDQSQPVSALKAQLFPMLMKMVPGKYDESMPKKRFRYEVPANKVGAIAEVLKIKFQGKDIVVEEKDDAVEVLSSEDVEDIIVKVLVQLGLVDDDEAEEFDDENDEEDGGGMPAAPNDGVATGSSTSSPSASESKNNPFKRVGSLEELRNDTSRMKNLMKGIAD